MKASVRSEVAVHPVSERWNTLSPLWRDPDNCGGMHVGVAGIQGSVMRVSVSKRELGCQRMAYPPRLTLFTVPPAGLSVPLYCGASPFARSPAAVAYGGMGGLGCPLATHIKSPFPGPYFRVPGEFRSIGLQAADQARREVPVVPSQQPGSMVFVLPLFVESERAFCTLPEHGGILPWGS